jgi:hypothetical protein
MNKYLLILLFATFGHSAKADLAETYFPEPRPVLDPIFDEKGMMHDFFNKLPNHYFNIGCNSFSITTDLKIPCREIYDVRQFLGYQLNYEFIKLDNFYFGVDFTSNYGMTGFDEDYFYLQIPEKYQSTNLWNLETRIGFSLPIYKAIFSPFIGTGIYKFDLGSSNAYGFYRKNLYLPFGFRLSYAATPCCNIGLNCKFNKSYKLVTHGYHPGYEFPIHSSEEVSLSGYEIGFPIILKRYADDQMYVKVEQYLHVMDKSSDKINVGTKLFIGYAL